MAETAVVVLGQAGLATARRIASGLDGAVLHAPLEVAPDADTPVEVAAEHLRALFAGGQAIVGVCAAGILIRCLAPLLADKGCEPPVVAVAADGASVVPLVGGHRGANALALRVAERTGGHAALTTASDTSHGVALDDPPPGWKLAPGSDLKAVMASLRNGERFGIDDCLVPAPWLDPIRGEGATRVAVSVARTPAAPVVLHPQVLALGVGCERGTEPGELWELVQTTLAAADLAEPAVALVASLDLKAGEPAVLALAERLGVPARFFEATTLEAETPRLANPSAVVFQEVGCHGVAEGAALAAAGPKGRLVVAKRKSRRATCAVAQAPAPLDATAIGRPAGRLVLVSLGPGARAQRTRAADQALRRCTDLVGFTAYLDLVEPEVTATRHGFPLGGEVERCRFALDLAREGATVGLVGSGDVGIYAMAALVEELAATTPAYHHLPIETLPGVSAMHLAAARIGAPLGHDFCAISLSDLLTPWSVIEQRLEAAAAGDFVVAFYNPVSKTRRTGFARALAILGQARPARTPCVLARQLGRADETLRVLPLGELTVDQVDMLTVVLVGSRTTRVWRDAFGRARVFTPRGYVAS
ncbi:MAG: precorrin-3B C(17)-methyltransferase [Geminicoccaceae bacterium]|nr:MAG: precorrin-3B C(17)-methyltransferase [Geminicoccaceae bacterium]